MFPYSHRQLEGTADAALGFFVQAATQINLTNFMEPDHNSLPTGVRHDLAWYAKQVHCNCSWDLPCCQRQACCGGSPAPPPPPAPAPAPAPPAPAPPIAGGVSVGTVGPPRLVHANERNVSALGMAHFAQTLYPRIC